MNVFYSGIETLFQISFRKKIIVRLSVLIWLVLFIFVAISATDYGYYLRFPAIGFFVLTSYFTVYLHRKRTEYGLRFIGFGLVSLSVLIIFSFFLWTGSGRLILFQFVSITLFLFTSVLLRARFIKFVFLLMVPILIVAGGVLRDDRASLTNTLSSGAGAGSMFSTYRESELVFEDIGDGKFEPLYGDSYIAAFLFYVPRDFWEDKPVGFGNTLVQWYQPWMLDTGHSLAASFIAEAYGNFAYLGIALAPFLVFLLIRWLRRCFDRHSQVVRPKDLMFVLIGICFFGAIPDFIWGGIQPFLVRAVVSSAAIYFMFLGLRFFRAFEA
jgi:hypothetical protein